MRAHKAPSVAKMQIKSPAKWTKKIRRRGTEQRLDVIDNELVIDHLLTIGRIHAQRRHAFQRRHNHLQ